LASEDSYTVDGLPLPRIFVSARTGLGLHRLRHALAMTAAAQTAALASPEPDVRDLNRDYSSESPEGPEDFGTMYIGHPQKTP